MPFIPQSPDDFPTLGYACIDFAADHLAAPSKGSYEPFIFTREQEDFVLNWYALDPVTGKRMYRRGVYGRPRGHGKSPMLAAIAAFEALGDCVFDGWDEDGQPIGRPWRDSKTPTVQFTAVSEEQTANSWRPLLEMLRDGSAMEDFPGLDPMDTFVALPGGGRIEQRTSSGRSIKGSASVVFAVMDQTEEWTKGNGGVRLADAMWSNAAKTGGTTLESPNAFIPGEGSIAEKSANAYFAQDEGKTREKSFILYDHREAPATTEMSDRESLEQGLRYAYGDSSAHEDGCAIHSPACEPGWVDLDPIISTILDPASDPQLMRSDFLNQVTHASDSWISSPELKAIGNTEISVTAEDPIVLGFDGSRGRVKGKADATSLVAMRVSDGHLFLIGNWEPGPNADQEWTPPVFEIETTIDDAFERYNVIGLYADPNGWQSQVATWEAKYADRLKVKVSANTPMSAWPRGKNVEFLRTVEQFRQAVVNKDITYDESSVLTRHILNARRRNTKAGYSIYKAFPESPDKVDAAIASVNALKARLDALSAGHDKAPVKKRYRNRFI